MDEIQIVYAENETGNSSDNGTATGAVAEKSDTNPWPRLEEMFTFSSQSSDKKKTYFSNAICAHHQKRHSQHTKHRRSNLCKHVKVRGKQ